MRRGTLKIVGTPLVWRVWQVRNSEVSPRKEHWPERERERERERELSCSKVAIVLLFYEIIFHAYYETIELPEVCPKKI